METSFIWEKKIMPEELFEFRILQKVDGFGCKKRSRMLLHWKEIPVTCVIRNVITENTFMYLMVWFHSTDKMKRTALIHAVMNGNAHIASYLLRMGADANRSDSSGNSVVHYAAAYGWYFCVKLLLENANADPNKENDWKVTALLKCWTVPFQCVDIHFIIYTRTQFMMHFVKYCSI